MPKRFKIAIIFLLIILCVPLGTHRARADLADDDKIVIVLDAGHGGIDGGTAVGARIEKQNNLIIALTMRTILERDGHFKVILTRDHDEFLGHLERVLVAKEANADLLLSLHCNSSPESYPNGNMAYVSVVDRYAPWELAGSILDHISAAVPIKRGRVETRKDVGSSLGIYYWNAERQWDMPGDASLGLVSDYYSVTTFASKFGIPSIIVEHGYCSNANDDAVLSGDSIYSVADAECRAIIEYYTGHEHVFGDVETDFPSNCVMNGSSSARCTICGARKGVAELPAEPENHYWRVINYTAPTCTAEGYREKICQIEYNLEKKDYPIHAEIIKETLPASGHTFKIIDEVPAGHGVEGHLLKRCTVCGYTEEENTPGIPHTYVTIEEVLPDCENAGYRVTRCTVCGDLAREEVSAYGHHFELKTSVPATSAKDGYNLFICSHCGAEKTEVLSVCPHEFDSVELPPSCTEAGRRISICKLCGYVKEETIPAAGHDYDVQMSVDPTCTEEGYFRGKCKVCGAEDSEKLPALGHNFVKGEKGGLVCSICGYVDEHASSAPAKGMSTTPVVIAILTVILIQFVFIAVLLLRRNAGKKSPRL